MAAGGVVRARAGAFGVLALLAVVVAVAAPSSATVTVEGPTSTFTGALYNATAVASDPASVVLYEWDFDADGRVDVNRTDTGEAPFVFHVPKPDYRVHVNVTRLVAGTLTVESGELQVRVADGTPSVAIDLPDRLVSGVELTFSARASDPDASHEGEPFAYRWTLDGAPVPSVGDRVTLTAPTPGPHEVSVVVTDSEGLEATATLSPEFVSPDFLEGKSGAVNLGLLTAAASLALGLPLVALQRRQQRQAAQAKSTHDALNASEVASTRRASRPPGKVPLAASSEGAPAAPRISVGGAPAALLKTRECPVCHNAVDAETQDCPYCQGNDRAAAFEAKMEVEPYARLDLAEVRGVLQRARRERHLGRGDADKALLEEAQRTAEALSFDARDAGEWVPKAEARLEEARRGGGASGEHLERAEAYLKLAQSLSKARQFGKAARHARRAAELLDEAPGAAAVGDTGPLSKTAEGPEAAEARVRAEILRLRGEVERREVELDPQAFELVKAAEEFERGAKWAQALEVLSTLREKLERAREAAAGPAQGAGSEPPAPPPG